MGLEISAWDMSLSEATPLYFSSELQVYLCFQIVLANINCLSPRLNIIRTKICLTSSTETPPLKKKKTIMIAVQQENLATWLPSDVHISICRHQLLAVINTWRGSMTHCHSSSGYHHDSFLSRWLWINLLQARNYASESSSAYYYFCLFASIVDGDLGVWAAWVACVARLL